MGERQKPSDTSRVRSVHFIYVATAFQGALSSNRNSDLCMLARATYCIVGKNTNRIHRSKCTNIRTFHSVYCLPHVRKFWSRQLLLHRLQRLRLFPYSFPFSHMYHTIYASIGHIFRKVKSYRLRHVSIVGKMLTTIEPITNSHNIFSIVGTTSSSAAQSSCMTQFAMSWYSAQSVNAVSDSAMAIASS